MHAPTFAIIAFESIKTISFYVKSAAHIGIVIKGKPYLKDAMALYID